jgi:predicted nucleic acid-binding protein
VITVVFDTNIFISAFEFGGVPRDAFLLAFTEIRRRLERLCTVVEPTERITDCSDPDDTGFLNARSRLKQGTLSLGIAPFYA